MSAPERPAPLDRAPLPLGLAVSGGSDSTALLHLAADLHPAGDLRVATVDHGLRSGAVDEIAQVAAQCHALGIAHDVLRVDVPPGANLQARARGARYGALNSWGQGLGLGAIALGHTLDDQAETVVMRLARGSGVDGLAAMPHAVTREGMQYIRPLLGQSRQSLRALLTERGISWCEDPSNADPRFDRVKARHLMPELARIGVTAQRLSQTADWMEAARQVLEAAADTWAATHASAEHGDAVLDLPAIKSAPQDTAYRVIARILCAISGNPYRPRFSALSSLTFDTPATLHGCTIYPHKGKLRITREAAALSDGPDPRWTVTGPMQPDHKLRPLQSDGLSQLSDWRAAALLPRRSLLASPSVWAGNTLIAAPLAQPSADWHATAANPLLLAK